MNIHEAVDMVGERPTAQETLNVVGEIERDSGGKVRINPDPFDLSHYVLVDPESVYGEVLDVTEHARRANPSRRGPVFSVPVRKGAEIQIVSVKTIAITDVAKMRFLSLNQSGGCGCAGEATGHERGGGCNIGNCITVEGASYDCWETWEGFVLCSGCCLIAGT